MPITALYAALLAPLYIILAGRVIRARRAGKIAVGDGGDTTLLRRMRVHANFAEYVPFALILLGLSESLGSPPLLLHAIGAALLLGRLSHAIGMSRDNEILAFRGMGMIATFTVIIVAALSCLAAIFTRG